MVTRSVYSTKTQLYTKKQKSINVQSRSLNNKSIMYSKQTFFAADLTERNEGQGEAGYIRTPLLGWNMRHAPYFVQLSYQLNNSAHFFRDIVIHASGVNKFDIIFKNPKNPAGFEKNLEEFNFNYDELSKEFLWYEIKSINLNQLLDVLACLHNQDFISAQLLQDIKIAIIPDNPDLMEFNEAFTEHLKRELYDLCTNRGYLSSKEALPSIEKLLKENTNANLFTHFQPPFQTPLMGLVHKICDEANQQIANMLLQHGAQVNCRDIQGRTALHHAATHRGDRWLNYLLLKIGADATLTDGEGKTAKQVYLDSCKNHQWPVDPEIIALFEKAETYLLNAKLLAKAQHMEMQRPGSYPIGRLPGEILAKINNFVMGSGQFNRFFRQTLKHELDESCLSDDKLISISN